MKNKFSVILLVSVLVLIYWQWLLSGPRVATDFSLASPSLLKSQLNIPQTWSVSGTEGLGEYSVFTLWSWPSNLLQGILANLNISFALMQRILFIMPFLIIGGGGVWKLCQLLELSSLAKSIAALFYLTNTYILLVIDGGQLSISIAYALFPWAFMVFERSLDGNLKKKILAGLLVSGIGVFDIRFIYIFLLLGFIKFFYDFLYISKDKWRHLFFSWIKTLFVIGIIVFGLNAHWILILVNYPISSNFYQQLTQTSFTSFISLSHAILLLSPHWYLNIFGRLTSIRFEFFLIPFLVFLAPVIKKRDKTVGFWLIVALISIFLTKGASDPLPNIYQWLYYNIPGFSLFRDSSKFFFLIALSYTALIAITVDQILKINKLFKFKLLIAVMMAAYFIFLSRPVWNGQMTGTFSPPILQKQYSEVNKFIQNDKVQSNVFWIPTIASQTELNAEHPAVEAARLVQKRPFAQGALGAYEIFNFLREAPYMGQLFDVANIGYLVYPPLDLRRADPHPDNLNYYNTFLGQLSNLPWLSRIENLSIPTFKVKQNQEKLFIPSNVWWVIGSDDIYKESTKSAKLSLSKNALIFAEEFAGLGRRSNEFSFSKIILHNKILIDLAATLISKQDLIFPAQNLKHDPDLSGWWQRGTAELINWKDFLKTKYGIQNQDFDYGGGWAVGEGNLKVKVRDEKFKSGNILLARVLESSRSGMLKFSQDDRLIGQVDTNSLIANVRWFEVGTLTDDKEVTIESVGDINVVNALVSLPASVWSEFVRVSTTLVMQHRVVNFDEKNAQENLSTVSYKQISPTKYSVNVENLQNPSVLVFSQNFDSNWKLNGQSPVPVYSLLNGFKIEKNGSYQLSFEPQSFLLVVLVIPFLTLLISLILLAI